MVFAKNYVGTNNGKIFYAIESNSITTNVIPWKIVISLVRNSFIKWVDGEFIYVVNWTQSLSHELNQSGGNLCIIQFTFILVGHITNQLLQSTAKRVIVFYYIETFLRQMNPQKADKFTPDIIFSSCRL